MATPASDNKELIRRYFAAVDEQDWETFNDLFEEDVVLHQGGEDIPGRGTLQGNPQGVSRGVLGPLTRHQGNCRRGQEGRRPSRAYRRSRRGVPRDRANG